MATPRDIRRVALLALYQLDATAASSTQDFERVRQTLNDLGSLAEEGLTFVESGESFRVAELNRAFEAASGAWRARDAADAELRELAPEWPASRMPAVDRAILRLARYEIERGENPPKAIVNEAVELAKAFSTEKSPAFVNGLLGRVLARVTAPAGAPSQSAAPIQAVSPAPSDVSPDREP
jgi:N utilization substance protein B